MHVFKSQSAFGRDTLPQSRMHLTAGVVILTTRHSLDNTSNNNTHSVQSHHQYRPQMPLAMLLCEKYKKKERERGRRLRVSISRPMCMLASRGIHRSHKHIDAISRMLPSAPPTTKQNAHPSNGGYVHTHTFTYCSHLHSIACSLRGALVLCI